MFLSLLVVAALQVINAFYWLSHCFLFTYCLVQSYHVSIIQVILDLEVKPPCWKRHKKKFNGLDASQPLDPNFITCRFTLQKSISNGRMIVVFVPQHNLGLLIRIQMLGCYFDTN
ncbi:hypothetical protein L1987_73675 [Smallanthus sonchifolius]|uniref:Uncharacterized protein n=1 Tax=Smallanthus sonchifolius TaxID=185202 RepID=A0ACB9A297_9ASTR|nr:hypothetical protein L1987_73675 [Smallanthus sonchifolius]